MARHSWLVPGQGSRPRVASHWLAPWRSLLFSCWSRQGSACSGQAARPALWQASWSWGLVSHLVCRRLEPCACKVVPEAFPFSARSGLGGLCPSSGRKAIAATQLALAFRRSSCRLVPVADQSGSFLASQVGAGDLVAWLEQADLRPPPCALMGIQSWAGPWRASLTRK